MKVIYVKSVIEMIREARDTADRLGKKIDYIELTPGEWHELRWMFREDEGIMVYYVLGVEVRKGF